jgi:hydroxyacylglutathione hydrolase
MFFKQFFLPSLGHASYLVGDESTGKALVLDPRRDVDVYFTEAREQGLRLAYAIDTHGHNDYMSGLQELTVRQKVDVLGYAEAPLEYHHTPVKDGELLEMGDVGFEVMHTPGHTPEHVSLLVFDREVGSEPTLLLSGGALLVGDLARPDLLGGQEDAERAAVEFCHTIQEKILWRLPDHLEVFPTHVSGSLCGGNIGSRLSTTLGYERKTNSVLASVSSSEEFVEECIRLDNLPAVPPYWRRMRSQNLEGPALLGVLPEPSALPPGDFQQAADEGVIVLDARSPEAFGGAHVPGSLNVGLSSSFSTWAGTILPEGAETLLVLNQPGDLWDAVWQLLRIGYGVPRGWLAGGMLEWRTSGRELSKLPQITVHELRSHLKDRRMGVLDVRQPSEWAGGHIDAARFITGAEVPARLDDIEKDQPLAVICGSGYRSSAVASLLVARGWSDVVNVTGGMAAWTRAGYPVQNGSD